MVRPKATSKKSQKKKSGGGVDFKKYKRKLGRKLPPPKNATNTEIKSKAIILPEQSMASEREGLAVSKKGLTLKELLQQTSHHNAKVRRDALIGIKDLASKFPEELKLHKLVIIEKLRERISDEDRVVRETLYQLLKSTIFPAYKDETPGPIISLIMAYIFNAMTHLAFDIRMAAFKFFELVVQHYPSSFLLYAEKVLQNYEDLLKKNRFTSEDKSKLKNALLGLVRCLSLFPSTMGKSNRSLEKNTDAQGTLHAFEPEVPQDYADISSVVSRLEGLMPILVNYFQELTPSVLVMPVVDSQSFECMLCVLQSIDLALKYFIYGTSMLQTDFENSVSCTYGGYDVTVWGATLPVLFKKLLKVFPLIPNHHPTEKNDERYYILNVAIAEIFLHLNEWIDTSSISMEKILDFVENAFSGKICSNKAVREKHLVPLLPFITKLVSQNVSSWKYRLLQAFTEAFKGCKPESSIKLAFLCAIEEMSNRYGTQFIDASDSEIVSFQIAWMRELPTLLVQLGDRHPSSSKIVLRLLLRLGQHAPVGSSLAQEYDNMQYPLIEFYCTFREDSNDQGGVQYGPFIMLPRDCQDLAICSLYYFSRWDSLLLKSLTYSCLYHSLEPFVIFRVIEVLQSSYKAGNIQIADQISFLVTLLARFKASHEMDGCVIEDSEKKSNHQTFKAITSAVCSCLFQMGDNALVFQILHKTVFYQMSLNQPTQNTCAMLRMLALLDSRPTLLSEENVISLANFVKQYLLDTDYFIPENIHESANSDQMRFCKYYIVPCFVLFDKSAKLLNLVLHLMVSSIAEIRTTFPSHHGSLSALDRSNRISAIAYILLIMHKDVKMQHRLSSFKDEIRHILVELTRFQIMSSSSNNSYRTCMHGEPAQIELSFTDANPGRKFVGCKYFPNGHCKYFRWIDDYAAPGKKYLDLHFRHEVLKAGCNGSPFPQKWREWQWFLPFISIYRE